MSPSDETKELWALLDALCANFMTLIEENAHQLVSGSATWGADLRKLDTLRRKCAIKYSRSEIMTDSSAPRPSVEKLEQRVKAALTDAWDKGYHDALAANPNATMETFTGAECADQRAAESRAAITDALRAATFAAPPATQPPAVRFPLEKVIELDAEGRPHEVIIEIDERGRVVGGARLAATGGGEGPSRKEVAPLRPLDVELVFTLLAEHQVQGTGDCGCGAIPDHAWHWHMHHTAAVFVATFGVPAPNKERL